ncbi:hypothetical protein IFM58399_09523 [Aspergillus lentulus]|uniref:acyl--CoA ligase n=1 Tax=Aspergillus lentulus TaxID=293939 RepID=UPI0013949CCC|nr:uncharacterized protein IFM58399_09523 [Aspergillus lentulus]GFF53249.1 hypothetical protein IFM58399_09523 [Aspergillus lentulus]GFF77973.1 hypothetical protein IFM62136_09701 [Aspergillus lentulus]
MVFSSRWETSIPDVHLATLLFQSPSHPLSKTNKCFIDVDEPDTLYLTTHEFRLWSQRVAAGLRKLGVKTGDRVLVFSGNSIAFPVLYMGILMAGAIFTSANPAYIARELGYQVKDSGAVVVLCAETSIETAIAGVKLGGLSPNCIFVFNEALFQHARGFSHKDYRTDFRSVGCRYWGELVADKEEGNSFHWDELSTPHLSSRTLALNYSSGTTGVPKGVEVSHKNVIANILQFNYLAQLDPGYKEKASRSRWLCPLPMYHAMGQNMFIGIAITRGIPVYLMTKYDFAKFLRTIERFRITDLTLVPPIVIRMAKDPQTRQYDLSSIETIFCGAAPLGKEPCDEAERLWPNRQVNIKQGWGMTDQVNFGVRGLNVMKGYWRNKKATEECLTSDGWLKTGDVAYIDDDNKWHIVDRKKELIKVKGNQVAPAELEGLLIEHPDVADVAVIGIPHGNDEQPRAYVVLQAGKEAAPEEIANFLNSRVSRIKRVTGGVVFVDSIPKNPSGKILRKVLRDMDKSIAKSTGRPKL